MGKALYRSYRSKSFDEVIGQTHITETLENSIKNQSFVHAYLLTGPRGVGKTSVARILAHEVNGQKYPSDESLVDIIEIDAASNRRIDEIRELRERVVIAPTKLKYKVYIIDEVHMLTREAFNALLKTLEEPPEHVIFILATTDFHKVPDTIVSRCVRFQFKPINLNDIKSQLQMISKSEKINIEDDALEIIAENSDGSFRDGIALLDQIKSFGKKVSADSVRQVLGLGSYKLTEQILENVSRQDSAGLLKTMEEAYTEGINESRLASQLAHECRAVVTGDSGLLAKDRAVDLASDLLDVSRYDDARAALEIALLKNTVKSGQSSNSAPAIIDEEVSPQIDPEPVKTKHEATTEPFRANQSDNDLWDQALDKLKDVNRGLYSISRMAEASVDHDKLFIKFKFAFHQRQANQSKNKKLIFDTVKTIDAGINSLSIELDEESGDKSPPDNKSVDNISNIFGASEVLES